VESIVLLKNTDNVLPLRRGLASILVAGPTAANIGALLGNYHGASAHLVTIMEGIVERADETTRVKYRPGCPISQPVAPGINYTFGAADSSEIVIAVMGLDHTLEGEEGDAVASVAGGDRAALELPENQRIFLRELRQHSKKLILILTGGSALSIPAEFEYCDAVLQVWYPGCEGGRAVADVLFGDVSPSGKLPLTVPRSTADLPEFNNYSMTGRTYRFAEMEPLFPFGFGLGYAKFAYGPLVVDRQTLQSGQELVAQATLQNTSALPADETVQCYIVPPRVLAETPHAFLVDFKKIKVPAQATVNFEFKLTSDVFQLVNAEGKRVLVPGNYRIIVGSASPGPRAVILGAPVPTVCEVRLT
jgi:beta-glucosidase